MKVPKGKTVYYRGKSYRSGDELPEMIAEKMKLESGKAPASGGRKRPASGAGEADKPGAD